MSLEEPHGEELLQSLDNELRSQMPPDCYTMYKRFSLCKLERNQEVYNSKGMTEFLEYSTEPLARVEGCSNEFSAFETCYTDFLLRYANLKNYVSEIQGKPPVFNIAKTEKNIKQQNFLLNKF